MNIHTLKGTQPDPLDIDSAGDTWHLTSTASITSSESAITLEEVADGTHLIIDGALFSQSVAVAVDSTTVDNVTVDIGKHATLVGTYGVLLLGKGETVESHGFVTANTGFALAVVGAHGAITNFGKAVGPGGLGAAGDGTHIINEKGAVATGSVAAVLLQSLSSDTMKFINHGTVAGIGDAPAVSGGLGHDIVVSDGRISGDISLGDGDDSVDLRGGTFHGKILGGTGDDTLITDTRDFKLTEGRDAGIDTVKSTVSYHLNANVETLVLLGTNHISAAGNAEGNFLTGNNGDNVLHGGDGSDSLDGGKGNDKLFGDAGRDMFHFATGEGHDTITDFTQGADHIELVNWQAVHSFAAVKSHARDHGGDVIIEAGHDSLTIHGLHKADLTADDFFFAP
jgi:serralysin